MSGSPAALRELWHRWSQVVEQFARRRRARRRLTPREYGTFHHELVQLCRALAEGAVGAERVRYEGLEALAQPWLALRALEQADREVLFDLLQRCLRAEQEL